MKIKRVLALFLSVVITVSLMSGTAMPIFAAPSSYTYDYFHNFNDNSISRFFEILDTSNKNSTAKFDKNFKAFLKPAKIETDEIFKILSFYSEDVIIDNDKVKINDLIYCNLNRGNVSFSLSPMPYSSYIIVCYWFDKNNNSSQDSDEEGNYKLIPFAYFGPDKKDFKHYYSVSPKKIYLSDKSQLNNKYYMENTLTKFYDKNNLDCSIYTPNISFNVEWYKESELLKPSDDNFFVFSSDISYPTDKIYSPNKYFSFSENSIGANGEDVIFDFSGSNNCKIFAEFLSNGYSSGESKGFMRTFGFLPVYTDINCTDYVTIPEVSYYGVKRDSMPNKIDYVEGEVFNLEGYRLHYWFSDDELTSNINKNVDYSYIENYPLTKDVKKIHIVEGVNSNNILDTINISVTPKAVSKLTVINPPTNKNYIVGQTFDPTDMQVQATYNDGTTENVNNKYLDFVYKTGNSFTAGENYITISYGGQSTTTSVVVANKTVTGIKVTKPQNKIKYFSGQSFDRDGMEVTATYNDGSSAVISGYSVTPSGPLSSGNTEVTVSFSNHSDTTPVIVEDKAVTSIEVITPPKTKKYTAGQMFNKTGMVVKATYSDNSTANISDYTIPESPLVAGQTEVLITYDNLYCTTPVEVTAISEITGIKVTQPPTKTSYVAGDKFDKKGMVVKAVYSDDTEREINNYTVPSAPLAAGQTTIYVTYDKFFAPVTVSVSDKEITNIEITQPPSKKDYVEGEVFNPTGMVVTATYNDKSTGDLAPSQYTYNTAPLTTSDRTLEVRAGDKKATTPISVVAKEITSIAVTKPPKRISYIAGQAFDPMGMEVTATYNDRTTAVINDYEYSPKVITENTDKITVSKNGNEATTPITVSAKEIISIRVSEQPIKTKYFAGQEFDPDGMIVTGYYNDGTTTDLEDYILSEEPLAAGQTEVYITYNNLYCTTPVEVAAVAEITAIKVVNPPTKQSYVAGQEFDKAGLVVKAIYSDGSEKTIDNYTVSSTVLAAGQDKVYITYNNFYTYVIVSVSDKEITNIEITQPPSKKDYVEGEIFNPAGMVVKATYSDHSTANLAPGDYTYKTSSLTVSDKSIVIAAGDMTATTPISVVKKSITGIKVTNPPAKTSYVSGQAFDPTGMEVTATYNDGSSAVINDYDYAPNVITEEVNKVTVSKNGFTAITPVNVSDRTVTAIKVTEPPAKKNYIAGEKFNRKGMEVTAYYNDGDSSLISNFATDDNVLVAGQTEEYVTYDNLYATTPINVIDRVITGIKVTEQPTKTSYVAGQEFNSNGMVVKATYSDGTEENVTSYNYSPAIMTAGTSNVIITYNNFYASVSVSVASKEITNISLAQPPTKTDYVEGEVFNPNGMLVKATYNDGTESYLAPNEYTYNAAPLTMADKTIEVRAGNTTLTVPIKVVDKAITRIEVTQSPKKINYVVGQTFNANGMIVTAFYNDGTSAEISDYDYNPKVISGDTTEITVSKDGKSDTLAIIVADKVADSIKVTTPPKKQDYYAGEIFNNAGMIVTAYYNDGTEAEIRDYIVDKSPLTAGQREIYITYDNLYCTTPINVSDKVVTGIKVTEQPAKTSYVTGQEFDPAGMIVTAIYSDGSEQNISDYTYKPAVVKTGTSTVMIIYDKFYSEVPVSVVKKEITRITLSQEPDKVEYVEGEIFNETGMLIKAYFNDDTESYLAPNEYSYSKKPFVLEDRTVTVNAGNASLIVPIKVIDKEITGIDVTQSPKKISYVAGQSFDPAGMIVKATYNDGTSAEINDYDYNPKIISGDTTEITVSKNGKSDTVAILTSDKVVTSIKATTPPTKKDYVAGEKFNKDGMVVTGYYNDGTEAEIRDYSISENTIVAEQTEVYITYNNLYCTTPINVTEKVITDIKITNQPDKVDYVAGQSFDPTGMVVTAYYNDGTSAEILGYEIDTDVLTLGTTKIYVTYDKFFDFINVSVVAKAITRLEVVSQPDKADYVEGELFNDAGLMLRAYYNDGTDEILTPDMYSYSDAPLTTDDTNVSVSAGGQTAEIPVKVVKKEITRLVVTKSPDKIDYVAGQAFDPTGMIVTAFYNDGTETEISDYVCCPEVVTEGTKSIEIVKDNQKTEINISVIAKAITSIAVTKPPTKSVYLEGEVFNPEGMEVTAYYNDGTEAELFNYNVDKFNLSAGTTKVYITYDNLYCITPISVNSKVIDHIEIITAPVKTEYVEGEAFDPTGMVVKAFYNDNSTAILEEYDYTPQVLSLGDAAVVVNKEGHTAEQFVTVIEKVVVGIKITTPPDKTDYKEGETFDPTGMVVTAYYNDGTEAEINNYTYTDKPFEAGDKNVVVEYKGYSDTVDINLTIADITAYITEKNGDVNRDGQVSPEDAAILTKYLGSTERDFNKHAVHTGDIDGDGSITEEDITLAKNCLSETITLEGDSLINADITGDGYLTAHDITLLEKSVLNMWTLDSVYELNADANDDAEINMLDVVWILNTYHIHTTIDHIEIIKPPVKTEYIEGQAFDPTGMVVEAVYKDLSREIVNDYTYSEKGFDISDTAITIEYEGHTAEQPIEVIKKVIVGSDEDMENSTEVTTEISSETTTDNNFETTTTTSDSGAEENTEQTSEQTSEVTTEANYGNSEGVRIINLPTKTEYVEGQTFDPTGILIELSWNDGSKTYIDEKDVSIDDTPLTLDDIYGIIYYTYKNGVEQINVPINVIARKPVSVEIVTPPDKTDYIEGETFDKDGIQAEVTYNDGTKETVDAEDIDVLDNNPLTPDDNNVKVEVEGLEAEVDITVSPKPEITETTTSAPKSSGGGGGGGGKLHIKEFGETSTEIVSEASTEVISEPETDEKDNRFDDVIDHWAEDYIEFLHKEGIVKGVTDDFFKPDLSTKRGDFAIVLNRLLPLEKGTVAFNDVPKDSYYANAIANCAAAGIFIGYGDGTFRPENTITRQEMMVIMAKIFSRQTVIPYSIYYESLAKYNDANNVSGWAKPYVNYLCGIGAVVGDEDYIRPKDDITRAEMSVIIYNYLNKE